jgi:hypothetical protein
MTEKINTKDINIKEIIGGIISAIEKSFWMHLQMPSF